jgi:hypothetical protein
MTRIVLPSPTLATMPEIDYGIPPGRGKAERQGTRLVGVNYRW